MLRSKSDYPVPPLYSSPAWVELSTRVSQLSQRRSVLTLKASLRANAAADLATARASGLAKAHVMFEDKSRLARARNEHFIGDLEVAKENFKVLHNTAAASESIRRSTALYLAEVDRLYPGYQEGHSLAALQSIQTMEACRAETDRRRQVSKDAFSRSQSLYALLEARRQDLAVAQLLEHNEELERQAARQELAARARAVDGLMLEEATNAGREARRRVQTLLQGDTKEELKAVSDVLRRGWDSADKDGEGGTPGAGARTNPALSKGLLGDHHGGGGTETLLIGGFDFKGALAEQAALDANARLHSQWLTAQLARSAAGQTTPGAASAGRLPLPTVEGERQYSEELYARAAEDAKWSRGGGAAAAGGGGSPRHLSSEASESPSDGQRYMPHSPPRAPHVPSPRSTLHKQPSSAPSSAERPSVPSSSSSSPSSSLVAGPSSTQPIVLGAGVGMSVKFSSPLATVGGQSPPKRGVVVALPYSFASSADVCRNFSLPELARVVRHISRHVDAVRLSDPEQSFGDDAIPKSKKVSALSSIVRSDSTDQALDHEFMVTLLFDILHASRAQLLPVDLLQGTSKKIADALPKYHKRMKGGRGELWEEVVNLLRDTASERGDSHRPFAACLAPPTAPGGEDRTTRKVMDLLTYLVSEGGIGGGGDYMGTSALDEEAAAAASRSFAFNSSSGGNASATFGQRSAAMRSYEEFGDEDDIDGGGGAGGGGDDDESNNGPIDEFDF